jgi:hypothetical protein
MSAVTLHRIDAARRMSRFYRLDPGTTRSNFIKTSTGLRSSP